MVTFDELREQMCHKVPEANRLSERDFRLAFAMSKMPVKDEELKLDSYL